jgi:hypothetical protein
MNADDFAPENEWADYDQRIFNVDPRLPPKTSWTGEELRKHFHTLKTKFALVDECFFCSGNVEAGADIDEAYRSDGHIRRLLPIESSEVHTMLLFAYWAFDKNPPKFISRAKPEDEQFDTSTEVSAQQPKQKKTRQVVDGEAIAVAVSSLAPSKEEQAERIFLLREERLNKRSQEKWDYRSWKHSECEKFLSNDLSLPPAIKEQLQEKMSNLAQDFLSNNF